MTTITAEPTSKTTVELWKDGGWTRWVAHFATADQAIAYVQGRNEGVDVLDRSRVNIDPMIRDDRDWIGDPKIVTTFPEAGPLTPDQIRLMEYLFPQCHHGMDATLCMDPYGPNHWGTMEQEMARGW